MEEALKRIAPKQPREALKNRVMAAAAGAAIRRSFWDAVWDSKAFRAAAALVVAAFLATAAGSEPQTSQPFVPDAEAAREARELAASLGNGGSLEKRFARQLSGRSIASGTPAGALSLMEEFK